MDQRIRINVKLADAILYQMEPEAGLMQNCITRRQMSKIKNFDTLYAVREKESKKLITLRNHYVKRNATILMMRISWQT